MPYPFHGPVALSYTQYLDTDTGRMLQAQPGRSYGMQPVPGAGDMPVPPGDGLWGPDETAAGEFPAAKRPAETSAPPGAPDQPALKAGRTTTPAADAVPQEG